MDNHVLLHQTFSWSCFYERNTGKMLINMEENTSSLEFLPDIGSAGNSLRLQQGSRAAQSSFDLLFWKAVLFEWVGNVGGVFMGSVAGKGDNGQSLPDWLVVPWWSMWGQRCCRMAPTTSKRYRCLNFKTWVWILVLLSTRLVILDESLNCSEVHRSKCEMGIDILEL